MAFLVTSRTYNRISTIISWMTHLTTPMTDRWMVLLLSRSNLLPRFTLLSSLTSTHNNLSRLVDRSLNLSSHSIQGWVRFLILLFLDYLLIWALGLSLDPSISVTKTTTSTSISSPRNPSPPLILPTSAESSPIALRSRIETIWILRTPIHTSPGLLRSLENLIQPYCSICK